MATRYVYDSKISKLQDTIEKLNRRAAKLGVEPIALEIGPRETIYTLKGKETGNRGDFPELAQDVETHQRAAVTLDGTPPRLNGWTFAAAVDHVDGTVNRFPGAAHEINLEEFRGAAGTCDHCNTERRRHETFVVAHEDGRTARVGRNCLKDFLGHQDPARLLGWMDYWNRALDALEEAEEGSFDGGGSYLLELWHFLAYVVEAIESHGWLSRGAAWENRDISTADIALGNMTDKDAPAPTLAHVARANKALAWARELTEDDVAGNDYLFNLRAICALDGIKFKRAGLAASVIVTAEREGAKAERKRKEAETNWLAVEEGRYEITGLVLVEKSQFSDYGETFKMLVLVEKPEGSFKVWGSVPKALWMEGGLTGRQVTFTAAFEAHATDKGFGFYKRPTKATVAPKE